MKRTTSYKLSDMTLRQIKDLQDGLRMSQTELLAIAIDRMYREEIKMSNKQPTVILNESGYNTGMTFVEYCAEATKYGDDPSDNSSDIDDFAFVSVDYARNDPAWDVPEGWPEDLPLWEYRP